MIYLRNIETSGSNGVVTLTLPNESVSLPYNLINGQVEFSMPDFDLFIDRDDVSLSPDEADELLMKMEHSISDCYDVFLAENRNGGAEEWVGNVTGYDATNAKQKADSQFECDDLHNLFVRLSEVDVEA